MKLDKCIIARTIVLLFGAPLLSVLWPQEAHANVVCLIDNAGLDFGSAEAGSGSINWTCTNYRTAAQTFDLCVSLGNPSWPGTVSQPKLRGTSNNFLDYNVYRDASSSQVWSQSQPLSQQVSIAGGIGTRVSGTFTFYARVSPGQSPPPDNYQAFFYNTVLGFLRGGSSNCRTTAAPYYSAQQFTLSIRKTVSNDCVVTALGPADLGQVAPSPSAVFGSTAISVRCPNGTPYAIGLQPSNGSMVGSGILAGTGGSPDTPAYQLHQNSISGPIWGNTASTSGAGNGVGGTGNGNDQTYPVYISMPTSEFIPDTYRDTVTVTVHF